MLECHLEEELQSGDRGVESDRGDATIRTMQLVAAQIFVRGRVRRAAEVSCELSALDDRSLCGSPFALGFGLCVPHAGNQVVRAS
jgi:hypothetical protein